MSSESLSGSAQTVSNTEILMFIFGWQGGTVHQIAKELGCSTGLILNADYAQMQDLMRLAQSKRGDALKGQQQGHYDSQGYCDNPARGY